MVKELLQYNESSPDLAVYMRIYLFRSKGEEHYKGKKSQLWQSQKGPNVILLKHLTLYIVHLALKCYPLK